MPGNFSYYLFVGDLAEVKTALGSLEGRYRSLGNVPAAQIVRDAYEAHIAQLEGLAFDIAIAGTEALRTRERVTRKRPDTLGAGGPRLGENLFADPLSFEGLPGSVGIANLDILDANVPWWSTNEEGSHGRVGAKLYGVFEPGGWIPDSASRRVHPIFEPLRSEGGEGGWMTVSQPIPARRFIETAIPEIRKLWHDEFDILKAELEIAVAAAALV